MSPVHLLSLLSLLNQLFKKEFKISFLENAEQAEQAEQVYAQREKNTRGRKAPLARLLRPGQFNGELKGVQPPLRPVELYGLRPAGAG